MYAPYFRPSPPQRWSCTAKAIWTSTSKKLDILPHIYRRLDGDDHLIYTGDADRVVDEAQAFFSRHVSVEAHAERLLATVLSVAATSHDQAREATALLDRTVALYRGRRVGAEELEATFDGPERAIR